ncbi:MAG: IS110 family transposase [Deltaproteobacteria bacterium]|jgi:transposase|nr:IS110 family transposase [Deltaproteobacteria bacterium]
MSHPFVAFNAIYGSVVGVDVHKRTHVARYLRPLGPNEYEKEIREFGTFKSGLNELCDWVIEKGASQAIMESTGVYWNTLEMMLSYNNIPSMVVNPCHVKNLPGGKTDTTDSEWLAKVGCCGLVKGSFIPDRLFSKLRDLSNYRASLVKEYSGWKNRLNKTLVTNGIRLDLIASDIHGVIARILLDAILDGKTSEEAAALAGKRVRASEDDIKEALDCDFNMIDRRLIRKYYRKVIQLEQEICEANATLRVEAEPLRDYIDRLTTIPGVDEIAAIRCLAEFGTDMTRFKSYRHLSSWRGVSPGNNESAGKRKSGKRSKGDQRARSTAIERANARIKIDRQMKAKHDTLVYRKGHKKAICAVAHKIVRIMYCLIAGGDVYRDGTVNYKESIVKRNAPRWIRQLKTIGMISSGGMVDPKFNRQKKVSAVRAEAVPSERGGSKVAGKPEAAVVAEAVPSELKAMKRPRGRPKGSGEKGVPPSVPKEPN